MGQLILGGGGGLTEPVSSIPLGVVNPDSRISHVFFEDFSQFPLDTPIQADSLFLEKFTITGTDPTLGGMGGVTGGEGTSGIMINSAGSVTNIWIPRWNVDYKAVTKLIIEARVKYNDATNCRFELGFRDTATAGFGAWDSNGYGLSGITDTNTNMRFDGFSGQIGSNIAKNTNFNTYRVEVNYTIGGTITSAEFFLNDVSQTILSGVSARTDFTLMPLLGFRGNAASDDFFIDFIKCSAEG